VHGVLRGNGGFIRAGSFNIHVNLDAQALPQLLSTLTDEFAFRRISRIDVRVLPIQIEHRWQDIAASTPPPPRACYFAEAATRD
jgi:hypothetical protein